MKHNIKLLITLCLTAFILAGCSVDFSNSSLNKDPEGFSVEVLEFEKNDKTKDYDFTIRVTTPNDVYTVDGYKEHGKEERIFLERYYFDRYLLYVTDISKKDIEYYFNRYKDSTPLKLSGDSDDYVTTDGNAYFETAYCCVFLTEGIKVRGDTAEIIDEICSKLEDESGLSFAAETPYAEQTIYLREKNFDRDFWDVNADKKKVDLIISEHTMDHNEYNYGEVLLLQEDIDFDDFDGNLIHELAHILHKLNGPEIDEIMAEGFATYMTNAIIYDLDDVDADFDPNDLYSADPNIDKFKIEDRFIHSESFDEENFSFGYRFFTYLFETYNKYFFADYLEEISDPDAQKFDEITTKESLEALQKVTDDSVLKDFCGWYDKNQDKFEG